MVVTLVCVSVCLFAAACPHYCMDPDVTWGNGTGCLLADVQLADLQSVHGLRCSLYSLYVSFKLYSLYVSFKLVIIISHFSRCITSNLTTFTTGDNQSLFGPAACCVLRRKRRNTPHVGAAQHRVRCECSFSRL